MKRQIAVMMLVLATATLSGCGTMQSLLLPRWGEDGFSQPYGGVAFDLKRIKYDAEKLPSPPKDEPPLWLPEIAMRVCDLPISAALDTVLLPITLTNYLTLPSVAARPAGPDSQ